MKVVLLLFVALFGVGVYGQITASMKDKLLFAHNKARAEKGLNPLVWSDTVANVAQNYANRCVYKHSSGSGYGENIGAGWPPGSYTVNAANRGWIDEEYGDWRCGDAIVDGDTRPPANYDHYTQVMWASTTSIGCGWVTDCPPSPSTNYNRFDFIVCNFNSSGNIIGRVPFPASQCNNIVPCSPDNTCNEKGNVDFYDAHCQATISCPVVTTTTATTVATTAATTAATTSTTARPTTTTTSTMATSVRPSTTTATTVRPVTTTTTTTATTAVSTATTSRTSTTTTATTRSSTATTTTTQSSTAGTSKSATTTTATTPTTTASTTPSTPTTSAPSSTTSTPPNDSVGESSASVLLPSFLALLSVVALFVLSRL